MKNEHKNNDIVMIVIRAKMGLFGEMETCEPDCTEPYILC